MKALILFFGLLLSVPILSIAQSKEIIINIQFDNQIDTDIQAVPAILKYDKEFAFSFTFDDGRSDAFSLGYKLMAGGHSEMDSLDYPGLFYTDGCGNLLPFRAGISWYTANSAMVDLHLNTPSYLTYNDAKTLSNGGWDFFNHSYNHQSGLNSSDYVWQLTENSKSFKANTGINFNICVPPDGDTGYIAPAFALGALACITSMGAQIGNEIGADITIPVPSPNPIYWRHEINSDNYTAELLKSAIDRWVGTTGQGKQKWWNEFTHRIDYKHIASSLEFPAFRSYFEYLEQKYGRLGKDNGWFAGSGEVLDYLLVRDKVIIHNEKNGSLLSVHIDFSNVPETLRHYNLSLLVKNPGHVESIRTDSPLDITYHQTSEKLLINIDFPDSYFSGINETANETLPADACYPNPTTGKLIMNVPVGISNPRVVISDMRSLIISEPPIELRNNQIYIDLGRNKCSPGIYVISLFSGQRLIKSSKVILNF